jgi:hypothetical protein
MWSQSEVHKWRCCCACTYLCRYLPAEAHGLGWQAAQATALRSLYHGQQQGGEGGQLAGRLQLPHPFARRPRLGARLLVQVGPSGTGSKHCTRCRLLCRTACLPGRLLACLPDSLTVPASTEHCAHGRGCRMAQGNFGRLASALVSELSSWQAEPRRRGAQLLRTCLVLLEEDCGRHLAALLPAICKVGGPPGAASKVAAAPARLFISPLSSPSSERPSCPTAP